jgi:hypothetical protein
MITLLTPERVVKHEHDHVQKILVAEAPTGQTGRHGRSDRYVRPLPPEPVHFFPGGSPSGKKHPGLI